MAEGESTSFGDGWRRMEKEWKEHLRKQRFMEASDSLKLVGRRKLLLVFGLRNWAEFLSLLIDAFKVEAIQCCEKSLLQSVTQYPLISQLSKSLNFTIKKRQSISIQLTNLLKFPNNLLTPSSAQQFIVSQSPVILQKLSQLSFDYHPSPSLTIAPQRHKLSIHFLLLFILFKHNN
jgi:hypothetical protein